MKTITAQEIHTDFKSAAETLAAKFSIENFAREQEEVAKLAALGFVRFKGVERVNNQEKIQRLAELVQRYQIAAPNYKFISTELTVELCKKYNLAIGFPQDYIDDIPTKNVQDILNFKVLDESALLVCEDIIWTTRLQVKTPVAKMSTSHVSNTLSFLQQKNPTDIINDRSVADWAEIFLEELRSRSQRVPSKGVKQSFKIVATPNMFDMTGKRVNESTCELEVVPKPKPPKITPSWLEDDPIVLQPVEGGYLIVTAWGPESQDSAVINHQMN